MVRALLAVGRALAAAWLVELAGAALIVSGVYLVWGLAEALIAAGVGLVLKAFEIESRE